MHASAQPSHAIDLTFISTHHTPRLPAVGAALTSSRPQEIALLEQALRLEYGLWDLCCAVGDPDALPHNPPPAVRRAADHRQHIIALRTRLAILGRLAPQQRALGRLRRALLHVWRQVGRSGPLLSAIAQHEQQLASLYAQADVGTLGRASRLLWQRLGADLSAGRQAAPIVALRSSFISTRRGRKLSHYKASSKHWAYARL